MKINIPEMVGMYALKIIIVSERSSAACSNLAILLY